MQLAFKARNNKKYEFNIILDNTIYTKKLVIK